MTDEKEFVLFPDVDPVVELAHKNSPVRFSFWWIRCDQWEQKYRFLYSCIMPVKGRVSTKWISSDSDDESFSDEQGNKCKRRIVRRFLCVPGRQAHKLLINLVDGQTFSQACESAEVDTPDINPEIPLLKGEEWTRLFPFFFPEEDSLTFFLPFAKGRQSPTKDTGCYCTRFCPPSRFAFLNGEKEPDNLLQWAADVLNKETGVDFNKSAGDAFGSIEVFGFPSLDEKNRSLVKFGFIKDENKKIGKVSLDLSSFDGDDEFFAQVRTDLLDDISSDQLVKLDSKIGRVEIDVPEPVDGITTRIWRKYPSGRYLLWFENSLILVRELSISGSLIGLTGSLGSPWLEKLDGTKAGSRAKAFSKIAQVATDLPMFMSTRASWEKAIQNDRKAIRRIHPEKSEGRFFAKGWEGESKLDFAEWLKLNLSKHRGQILLTDPYFDVEGLELIARASGAAKKITVLTCTQILSDDDKTSKKTRSERLERVLKNLSGVFKGLKLRILDLRSKGGGKKQLFHDRYILFYGTDGTIEKGFNLSTSLQSATRTSPLLITPIPENILDEVADYAATILDPEKYGIEAEAITLFPVNTDKVSTGSSDLSPYRAESVLRFVEILQDRKDLASTNPIEKLQELNFYDGKRHRVTVPSCTLSQLVSVMSSLSARPLSEAAPIWDGMVEVALSGWNNGIPSPLKEFCEIGKKHVGEFLQRYLMGHATGELQAENNDDNVRTLAHFFDEKSFLKSLKEASDFLEYHHEFPLQTSWHIYLSAICLSTYFPELIEVLVEDLVRLGEKSQKTRSAIACGLYKVIQDSDGDILEALSRSRTSFVRALSAIAEWRNVQEGRISWEFFEQRLERYTLNERQEILARALFDLRVKANRTGSKKPHNDIPLHQNVIDFLNRELDKEVSTERIIELLPSFSGPLNGSWAISTNNEILDPLGKEGHLRPSEIFRVWNETLTQEVIADTFFSGRDMELVQVWGNAFWFATPEQQTQVFKQAKKDLERSERSLCDPFLQSRNYNLWKKAADSILLWMIRLWAIQNCHPEHTKLNDLRDLTSEAVRIVKEEDLVESAISDLQPISRDILSRLIPMISQGE